MLMACLNQRQAMLSATMPCHIDILDPEMSLRQTVGDLGARTRHTYSAAMSSTFKCVAARCKLLEDNLQTISFAINLRRRR